MRHATPLVLALTLVLAAPVGAQEPPLTLVRAMELARLHSPLLPVAEGRLRVAAGAARERAAAPNPVLELRQESAPGSLPPDRFTTMTLPLDLRLERRALRSSGAAAVSAAAADSAATAREVEATVGRLYWRSALAEALAETAAAEAAAMEELAAYEATRLREGVVAEGVVLRARLEVERTRLALARAEAEARRAHGSLAQAIGLPPAELPGVAVSAAAGPGAAAAATLPAPEGALERALLARPEMEAARWRVESARWEQSAALRGALPAVGLQVGARETAGRAAAVLALTMELPVLDRGAGARERARGERTLAAAELEATRRRVAAEVAQGLELYHRLLEALPAESAALAEQGAEVARVAEVAYREGAISLVELLDARRAHADARVTTATWTAELAIARLELQRALGAPLLEVP